ncbi:hypothetical protein D3C77_459820 [compost metagenome]
MGSAGQIRHNFGIILVGVVADRVELDFNVFMLCVEIIDDFSHIIFFIRPGVVLKHGFVARLPCVAILLAVVSACSQTQDENNRQQQASIFFVMFHFVDPSLRVVSFVIRYYCINPLRRSIRLKFRYHSSAAMVKG